MFGWWSTAPPGFWGQVILLSALPLGVIGGPRALKAHAQVASSLLAPTREEMAALVGRLSESRSQAVDSSAAELRRIERDLHDGAQARLVALGMNIGFAEQMVRDNPELGRRSACAGWCRFFAARASLPGGLVSEPGRPRSTPERDG